MCFPHAHLPPRRDSDTVAELLDERSLAGIVKTAMEHKYSGVIFLTNDVQSDVVKEVTRRDFSSHSDTWNRIACPVFLADLQIGERAIANSNIISLKRVLRSLDKKNTDATIVMKYPQGHVKGRALIGSADGDTTVLTGVDPLGDIVAMSDIIAISWDFSDTE